MVHVYLILVENRFERQGGTLAFYSNHQKIEVLADDVLIFSVQCKKSSFGKTPGCRWNFISISEDHQHITVHTTAAYATNVNDTFTFIAGNGSMILKELLRKTAFSGFMSIFNAILGICMIVLWFVANAKTGIEKSMLYLGQFAVAIGLWSFGENEDINKLIKLADQRMYNNKREMKDGRR